MLKFAYFAAVLVLALAQAVPVLAVLDLAEEAEAGFLAPLVEGFPLVLVVAVQVVADPAVVAIGLVVVEVVAGPAVAEVAAD